MAKKTANTVVEMVKRAYGAKGRNGRSDDVATDFKLEISAAEKKRLASERKDVRARLLSAG